MHSRIRWTLCLIGLAGIVVIGVLFRQPITEILLPTKPPAAEQQMVVLPEPEPWTPPDITPYLNDAQSESEAAIEKSLQDIRYFFDDAKKNSRSFAETAMSFGSKWRLMVDYVPFTRGDRNEEFLKQEFEKKIFSPNQLVKAVEQAVAIYIRRIEQIENNMLTRMKEDLPDLPETSPLKMLETSQVFDEYQKSVKKLNADSQTKIGGELAASIASIIAGEILTVVAVRLGISSGILGAGAGSSVYTLGIGIVVGVIVDYIVAKIWDWYADPKGELAKKIDEQLDTICNHITDELQQRLSDFSNSRSHFREEAIYELLTPIPYKSLQP